MEIITFFEKLDKNINLLTQEIILLKTKLNFVIDSSAPKMPKELIFGEPKGNNFLTVEELYNEVISLQESIALLLKYLKDLKDIKDLIYKNLKDFVKATNELEYLIFKRHYFEKQSLKKIAKDSGYSYSHIRRVHMNLKEKIEN